MSLLWFTLFLEANETTRALVRTQPVVVELTSFQHLLEYRMLTQKKDTIHQLNSQVRVEAII